MGISFTSISEKNKSLIKTSIKIVFSILILGFIYFKVDFASVGERLLTASKPLILLALGLMLVNLSVQFIKWEIIINTLIEKTGKRKLLKSLLLGISSSMITPLQTGVFLGRASVFEKKKIPKVMFATFFDKISTLFLTAFFGSLISLYFLTEKFAVSKFVTFPVLILLLLLAIFFFAVLSSNKISNSQIIQIFLPRKLTDKYKLEIAFADKIDANLFWKTFPLLLLQKILLLVQFSILIYAFGGTANFIELIFASLLVFFSKSFFPPVTVGDIGVREAMSIYFFGLAGIPSSVAFSAAVFLFIINLLLPSLVSLIFLARK